MRLSTINLIVEAILEEAKKSPELTQRKLTERIANEACIYLKTALICENDGIDKAMEYFTGSHSEDEYKDWQTFIVSTKEDK